MSDTTILNAIEVDDVPVKFTGGGVLNDINAFIDETLTQTNKAADAKVTGDEIADVKSDLFQTVHDRELWTSGYWAVADGIGMRSFSWARTNHVLTDEIVGVNGNGYLLFLLAYDDDTYIGTWNGSGFSKTYNESAMALTLLDLIGFRQKFPSYTFRLTIKKQGGSDIDLNQLTADIDIIRSKTKLNEYDIVSISGDFAIPSFWENGTIKSNGEKEDLAFGTFYYRVSTPKKLRFLFPITIIPKDGYSFSVTSYLMDGTFETQFSSWETKPYTIANAERLYRIGIKSINDEKVFPDKIADYISTYTLRPISFARNLAEYSNIKAVNHRGYSIAPENTLPAFELSAQYGFKYVETDVLFTSDGVPVLMHDASINRTARNADGTEISGTVNIADITLEEALTYDYGIYKGSKWAGTKIPTFEEFIRCCKTLNLHPWIELKNEKTYTSEEIALIIKIIRQNGMEEHVTIISFSYDALAIVAQQWDTVELGLNGTVNDASALKTGKNRVFMLYWYPTDRSGAINAGFQTCLYNITSIDTIMALDSLEFDSVLTDNLLPTQIYDAMRYKYEQSS